MERLNDGAMERWNDGTMEGWSGGTRGTVRTMGSGGSWDNRDFKVSKVIKDKGGRDDGAVGRWNDGGGDLIIQRFKIRGTGVVRWRD
jgi:hypothetical protein